MARHRAGPRRGHRPGGESLASASPARCTAWSCSTRPTRSSVPRSSGTTSARRRSVPRSRQRVGLGRLIGLTGNRALTGFTAPEAPLAPPSRAGGVRTNRPDHAAEGLRTTPAHGRVGDRRLRRVGDPPARRRAARLEHRGVRCPRAPARVASARRSSPPTPRVRWRVTRCREARRSPPAQATSPRPRSGSAPTGRGCSPSCSARRASSSHRSPRTRTTPRRASTPFATPFPGHGRRWA